MWEQSNYPSCMTINPIYKGVKLNIAVNYRDSLKFVDELGIIGCKQQKPISPYIKQREYLLAVTGELTKLRGAKHAVWASWQSQSNGEFSSMERNGFQLCLPSICHSAPVWAPRRAHPTGRAQATDPLIEATSAGKARIRWKVPSGNCEKTGHPSMVPPSLHKMREL